VLADKRLVAMNPIVDPDDPDDKLKDRMNRVKHKLANAINQLDA